MPTPQKQRPPQPSMTTTPSQASDTAEVKDMTDLEPVVEQLTEEGAEEDSNAETAPSAPAVEESVSLSQWLPNETQDARFVMALDKLAECNTITPDEIGACYGVMYDTFLIALNSDSETSKAFLTKLLARIVDDQAHQNKVFSDHRVFAGIRHMKNINKTKVKEFETLLAIFHHTADETTRKSYLNKLNISYLGEVFGSQTVVQRLLEFYNIG